jgi:hypothetical protein
MSNRGRTPNEVNERLIDETLRAESAMRKLFVDEAYLLFLDRLALDIDVMEKVKRSDSEIAEVHTQDGRLDAYTRGASFQRAVSILLMPEGLEDIDENTDGNERLRVYFPVEETFERTPEAIEELIASEEPLEMYTEWSVWHDGEKQVIRWVISEEKMIRYSSIGDTSVQVDEIDDFEHTFARLQGKRLSTRGDVLKRIIEDFVNFQIRPQKTYIRPRAS